MPIQLFCPDCRRTLRVPDHLIGTQVRCPGCQTIFRAATSDEKALATHDGFRKEAPVPSGPDRAPSPSRRPLPPKPVLEDLDEDDDLDLRPVYRRSHLAPHRGAMILTFGIMGILGWLTCALLVFMSPVAWIMGHADLKEIKAGRMDPEGEGLTRAGWILGIIGTVILVLGTLACMLLFAAGGPN